ncbi:mitochondrial 54S ribosomal protein mL61 ASCRUDRAFT_74101 [Ascoidea rubescens DSM 1968]|uniref:Ribosomal protein/NADH dehydrogenase domain-containing protein n=1 Tax=Ascoidea rubescens DSM 1968 TaxID=1344418 RepID=A0A1D2VSB8_9ASCO|nr:hypothetical protein ASCRUDRAFT_74101 [Ascoidea rubescens DSM 1968]ODV64490.1 hypothetical protein ASCRUDRAFT_74101 [Ascoidea rubescens DSM 1968]
MPGRRHTNQIIKNTFGLSRLTKQLNRLNSISNGPSAYKIDASRINSISLLFKKDNIGGHMSLRKFWHNYLPTLQFYNPTLPINVTRVKIGTKKGEKLEKYYSKVPCELTIKFKKGDDKVIDCKNKNPATIFKEFVETTKATKVPQDQLITIQHPSKRPVY